MVLICDHMTIRSVVLQKIKGNLYLSTMHSYKELVDYMHFEIHNLYCLRCKARKVITIITIMLLCMSTYTKHCENYKQVEWHMFMLSQDICCRYCMFDYELECWSLTSLLVIEAFIGLDGWFCVLVFQIKFTI